MPLRADRTVDDVADFAVGDARARERAYDRYNNSIDSIPLASENAKGGLLDYERKVWADGTLEDGAAYRARLAMWGADDNADVRRRIAKIAARELLLEAWQHDDGPKFSQAELVILAKHVLPDRDDPNRWSRAETCRRMRWSEPTLRAHLRRAREKAARWKAARPP